MSGSIYLRDRLHWKQVRVGIRGEWDRGRTGQGGEQDGIPVGEAGDWVGVYAGQTHGEFDMFLPGVRGAGR